MTAVDAEFNRRLREQIGALVMENLRLTTIVDAQNAAARAAADAKKAQESEPAAAT